MYTEWKGVATDTLTGPWERMHRGEQRGKKQKQTNVSYLAAEPLVTQAEKNEHVAFATLRHVLTLN